MGVLIAVSTVVAVQYFERDETPGRIGAGWAGSAGPWLAAGLFALLVAAFWHLSAKRSQAS
jgi:hypothetical protein